MNAYTEDLGDGLILHPVRDARDVARYIALNEAIVREGDIADRLLHHHPAARYDDYVLVEDTTTGEAVSTTGLIPWRCTYEGIALETAMLEMVVTHPDYRRRGLIRAQVERFHRVTAARSFDLCIIQGIPHYYRQYGYAYALDHTPCEKLPAWRIPGGSTTDEIAPYSLRPATPEDASALTALYQAATRNLAFSVQRTPEYWRYLLQYMAYPVRIVEDTRTKACVGYTCARRSGNHLHIGESAIFDYETGMAALRELKTETPGEMQIVGPPTSLLIRLARSLGSQHTAAYQWLLRIPNVARLLTKIAPVLEARLARAGCGALTIDLRLNLYREAFVLHFTRGALHSVEPMGFVGASLGEDGGDLAIPPDAFIRLLFGYRSLDALHDAWPDIEIKAARRYLWEALFPPMESLIVTPY